MLEGLAQRELVVRLPRGPGQKEQRYAQLLGADHDGEIPEPPARGTDSLEARVERLEAEVRELRAQFERASQGESGLAP